MNLIKLIIIATTLCVIAGCTDSVCGPESDAVKVAKGLSQNQLAEIHKITKSIYLQNGRSVFGKGFKNEVPSDLANIGIKEIKINNKHMAALYLAICTIDTKVVLFVHFPESGENHITLRWGESPTGNSIKLWQKA